MAAEPFLLAGLAFAPPLLYLGSLALRHPGRSGGLALSGFAYGATLSLAVLVMIYVLLAVLLGSPAEAFRGFFAERLPGQEVRQDAVVVVVLAPVTEELAKGLGVWLLGARLASGRDGVMLGAAAGLGFAGVETFLYLLAAWGEGGIVVGGVLPLGVLVVAALRSVSAAFVHPAATALTGFGIARARVAGAPLLAAALPFYAAAVLLHALYNYLAGFLPPQALGGVELQLNLPAALLLAAVAWGALKRGVAARA